MYSQTHIDVVPFIELSYSTILTVGIKDTKLLKDGNCVLLNIDILLAAQKKASFLYLNFDGNLHT